MKSRIVLFGLSIFMSTIVFSQNKTPEVDRIVKIEEMASQMMVNGMESLIEQIQVAERDNVVNMRVTEHCQTSAETLGAFGRGDITLEEARIRIVKSLHKDGADGIQFALSEGDKFHPSHMSTILVSFEKSKNVKYSEMIDIMKVDLDYAKRNQKAKALKK